MTETTTGKALHKWREWAIQLAHSHNIDPYEVDWLLQGLTPLTNTTLKLNSYQQQQTIPLKVSLTGLTQKWNQRITQRTPVQYLVGETPWRNFTLTVTPDVLIPRPETELIIDIVKSLIEKSSIQNILKSGHWADLGTGSGAIALALAHTFPNTAVHAVDISPAAVTIAKQNAKQNSLDTHITFHKGSWFTPLSSLKGKLSGIVTNPPYIPSPTVLTLQPEVTNHEPHLALDGGPDGLASIKTILLNSVNHLIPGGIWLTELMAGQAQTVTNILHEQESYTHISIHQDLSGIDRFVSARKAL